MMSTADEIKQKLAATLQRAETEARKADAAADVATFEGAKGTFMDALREKASELRKIKPKPTKVKREDGEAPAVTEARAHQAQALARAEAEMNRVEKMEGMHPLALQLDEVDGHLARARAQFDALSGQSQEGRAR